MMFGLLTFAVCAALLTCTVASPSSDRFFPSFHLRPAVGHVNDPNGPFRHAKTGMYHLFMQYCHDWPCHPGPGGKGWAHFASRDLIKWIDVGYALIPDGSGCPNRVGIFSGSATNLPDGHPVLSYPGVHNFTDFNGTVTNKRCEAQNTLDGDCMSMCTAMPLNNSDPLLRQWVSREIIPNQPDGMNWRFLDPSQMWWDDAMGRWLMFTGGSSTWDCDPHNPHNCSSEGLSMLYSTDDPVLGEWRLEHSLLQRNFSATGPCRFVSCPEMFSLPGMGPPPDSYHTGRHVYVAACAANFYWMGTYNSTTRRIDLDTQGGGDCGKYQDAGCNTLVYGNNHACKSMWDASQKRRLMWCWIRGGFEAGLKWDGMQSIPRHITLDAARPNRLRTLPAHEVALLRLNQGRPLIQLKSKHISPSVEESGSAIGGLRYRDLGDQLDIEANFTISVGVAEAQPNSLQFGVEVLSSSISGNSTLIMFDFAAANETVAPLNTHGVVWIDMTNSGSNVSKGRTCAPVLSQQPRASGVYTYTVRVLLDRSVIEVYSQDGATVLSSLVFPPTNGGSDVVFFSKRGTVIVDAQVYAMGSAYA